MDDQQILALFASRDEAALRALSEKYGGACRSIAFGILGSEEDAKEVLNDVLLNLWNAIPPAKPENLFNYLCESVRRQAYQTLERQTAQKRGGGKQTVPLDDAAVMQMPARNSVEDILQESMMIDALNRFLDTLPKESRALFIQRYGNGLRVKEIAEMYCLKQSTVLVRLMRTRNKLKIWLKKEGWL